MKNKQEIFETLRQLFQEMFEIDPDEVGMETTFQALDIDSIDAVDLMVRLHEITGKRIAPEDFKHIRTVGNVVEVIERLLDS